MNTNKILLDNTKTPEEKVYLIAKAIRDSGRPINDDLWYAILDLKDKNFPTICPKWDKVESEVSDADSN